MSKFCIFSVIFTVFLFAVNPAISAQVIKDDFRVNDDTTGGSFLDPDVEILENGGAIIAWSDERSGDVNIYGQIYDDEGYAVHSNFRVSSSNETGYDPAISSRGDSLLVIWRYGYGQWLLSDGSKQGESFRLTEGNIYDLDMAVSDSGFFVVWRNSVSGSGSEVFLQRFDLNGDSAGSRVIINDESDGNQFVPKIAMDYAGNFLVVWQDDRNGDDDIYGQRFDNLGNAVGDNFLINDDGETFAQADPFCAMDSAGNSIVVWEDNRNGDDDIFGQRFDNSGNTLGGNFLINDRIGSENQRYPACATNSEGNFIVVWSDTRDGPYQIYAQRFNNAGGILGDNFLVGQGSENQFTPRVSMNENNFVVTWQDFRESRSIYKRRFSNDGSPLENDSKVNEISGTNKQSYPAIDMNSAGNTVVTWSDSRTPWGIYFQRLNAQGDLLGANIHLNIGNSPDVSVSEDSSFVITYSHSSDIFYQRVISSGDPIGSPIAVSDTVNTYREHPAVDMDSSNNAVVVWEDSRNGHYDIYTQMVNSDGDTIGENFRVNDDGGTSYQYIPDIAVSPSGYFLIVWQDERNGDDDIYGQLYDPERNPIGDNFRINSIGTSTQRYPAVSYLPDGNFIVTWEDYRGPSGIFAQVMDTTGTFVDTNFLVSEAVGYEPSVATTPSGGFVITWQYYTGYGNNNDISGRMYDPDFNPGSIFKVNNEQEGLNRIQLKPCVATNGNSVVFAWQDPKWERGYDIAAKVFNWNPANIEEVPTEGKGIAIMNVSKPVLTGNEWLAISLDSPSKVVFQIINVAGMILSSKDLNYDSPGVKRVDFNVSNLPSGPYFLSFKSDSGRVIKKTLVIR